MKNLFYFFISALIGFLIMFLLVMYIPKPKSTKIVTPIGKALPYSLEKAPDQSIVGSMLSMAGEVNWESRAASVAAIITTPRPVQQGETISTGENGTIQIQFPNAVNLIVSLQSEIYLAQTLPANVVIAQDLGTVQYVKMGGLPVAVRTLDLLIKLSSGRMTVVADQIKNLVTVSVIEGKSVIAYEDSENVSIVMTVQEGSTFIFDDTTKEGKIL